MTHVAGNKVAWFWNLGFVRQKNPGVTEYPLHLQPAHVVAHENLAAHQTALHVDPIRFDKAWDCEDIVLTLVKYHLLFNLVQVLQGGKHRRPSSPGLQLAVSTGT